MKTLRQIVINLIFLVVAAILLFVAAPKVKAQLIDPHPACSAPNTACWPTRAFNQWSCNQCTFALLCQGNTNIRCYVPGNDPTCGGAGPCMSLCDPSEPSGSCNVVNNPVLCNLNSPTECGFRGSIANGCTYNAQSGCDLITEVQTLGCCGPGGATPTPTSAPTSTPTPTPTPSCSISFSPNPVNLGVADTANVTANVITLPAGSPIDRVNFAIGNTAVAAIDAPPGPPHNDFASPYIATVRGVATGNTELRATVYMGGAPVCGYGTPIDPSPDPVIVTNPLGWWQVVNGDVVTNGSLDSPIPVAACNLAPPCDPVFIVTPSFAGATPGLPSFTGTYDFNSGLGLGTVSSTNWLARAGYLAQTQYSYAFFERQVPGDAVRNIINQADITPNTLKTSGNISPDGYFWFFRSGDLILRGEPTLQGRRVLLFVDGNLTIDGYIDLTPGTGFFMAIVSGNITINPGVRHPGFGEPELEGIFVANGNFTTASAGAQADDPIQIRGMVAAYGAVDPNRDLSDNSATAAETFTYGPDLLFNIPNSLNLKRTRWKEVAP